MGFLLLHSLYGCIIVIREALVKGLALLIDAVAKLFAGLGVAVAGAAIYTFLGGIAGPNGIEKLVYDYHCGQYCNH